MILIVRFWRFLDFSLKSEKYQPQILRKEIQTPDMDGSSCECLGARLLFLQRSLTKADAMNSDQLGDVRAFAAHRKPVIVCAATGARAVSVSTQLINDQAVKSSWINDL